MSNPHGWEFLLDENIPFRLKYDLRTAGFPAVHVTDVGLGGIVDDVVYGHASQNHLIVITNDKGFHPPYPQFPSAHAGIILSRLGNRKTLRTEIMVVVIALAHQYTSLDNRIIAIEADGQITLLS
jgi:predicted nuclease of predicted toxin-antitoxin system